MPRSLARGFVHKQRVAAATWTIVHGVVNGDKCAVEVFIDVAGERVKAIPKNVINTNGTIAIIFSAPQTGEAYVI